MRCLAAHCAAPRPDYQEVSSTLVHVRALIYLPLLCTFDARVAEAFSFQARFVFDLLFSSLRCVLPAASRSNGLANGLKTLVLRVLNQLGQAGKPRGTVGADLTTSVRCVSC